MTTKELTVEICFTGKYCHFQCFGYEITIEDFAACMVYRNTYLEPIEPIKEVENHDRCAECIEEFGI